MAGALGGYEAIHHDPSQDDPVQSKFLGTHFGNLPMLSVFPRAESVDLTNDPRIFGANALSGRLVAFRTISVACVFLTGLSAAQMKGSLESPVMGPVQFAGLCMMTLTFLFNLFALVVLLQQIFQVYRLMTSSSIGFDFAKSYYLNPNITKLRHIAVKAFFTSLPMLISAMALKSFTHLAYKQKQLIMGIVVGSLMGLWALFVMYTNHVHSKIFKDKYAVMKEHELPLLSHMKIVGGQSHLATDV